ncbi:Locomotion-related protein Hikaru genki [Strongyloides ratti]|uniref:Locomotion-related protein Hikaru genki n=1 Tax=Strongyloides ratti TaxID=34506 RepID=A0A090LBL5_STRRB|nr:Locomotion-related protein Hikaru genki [Strongyloides ratti]CEF67156.1 Locomotion-related protein Hikaru genki [Strongyloides ratti]
MFLLLLFCIYFVYPKCLQPTIPENCQIYLPDSSPYEVGSIAKYTCSTNFKRIGNEERKCEDDGTWSGDVPLCGIDVAKDKPSFQSSGNSAMYAVTTIPMCSITENSVYESSSWSVDLLSTYKIRAISYVTGHLSGIISDIFLIDSNGQKHSCSKFIHQKLNTPNETVTVHCQGNNISKIKMIVAGKLHLCEFKAYAIDIQAPWQCGLSKMDVLAVYEGTCFSSSHHQKLDWKNAQKSCLDIGGTLPIRITNVTRTVIRSALTSSPGASNFYWIGLIGSQSGWNWADGDILNENENDWYEKPPEIKSNEALAAAIGKPASWKWISASQSVWNSFICQTKPKYCTNPGVSENSKVIFSSQTFTIGTIAFYSCEYGFKLIGQPKRRCNDDGLWSYDIPECKPITCPEPQYWEKGNIIKVNNSLTFGSLIEYKCLKGYVLDQTISNTPFRVCTSEGQWSNTIPSCKKIDCGIPPTIANGIFQANSYTLNSSAIYKCDENYQLMGHLQITCTESGTWQPQPPICLDPTTFKSSNDPLKRNDIILFVIIFFLLILLTLLTLKVFLNQKSYIPSEKIQNFLPNVLNHIRFKSREPSSGMTSSTLDRSSNSHNSMVNSNNIVYATPSIPTNSSSTITDNTGIYYTSSPLSIIDPSIKINGIQQIEIPPHLIQMHQLPNGNIQLTMPASRPIVRPSIPLFTPIPSIELDKTLSLKKSLPSPTNSQILYSFDYENYYDIPPDGGVDLYEEVKNPTGDAHCL